ncbi:hypothetical protein OB955_13605 [Halobacteria archaeon AArc-m2/3/4]|uniref:Uncharacterized protein n=1 Tax=Natronoglomus mannanivorans TaxID=2979990 RepID=A0ABT2QFR7_9EURY|nr:hypothetical protein [Halobacteria archaeon AArc-m2/3/4]
MVSSRSPWLLSLLLGSALLSTIVFHARFVPRFFPDDLFTTSLFLFAGWATFALVFYVLGRLFSEPGPIPSMRSGDIGTAVFLVSLLLSLFLDTLGFTFEAVLEAHVLPALGVYVGLALIGWSIGQRTKAINQISTSD